MRAFRFADFARSLPALFAIALLFTLSGCAKNALPEVTSPGAQLYASRCAQCHAPYNPHTMTADMWRAQVPMMEDKMRQAGLPPLSDSDRAQILDYLSANAGQQ
jgi:mono/diheme cytochrome c family protein